MMRAALLILVLVLAAPSAMASDWDPECRGLSPEKTVACAAAKQKPPGGRRKALSVWRCESGWGTEQGGTGGHSYHGPFQFLRSTYTGQRLAMPDVSRFFELSPYVHNARSNIIVAVAWATRHGWTPWAGCA